MKNLSFLIGLSLILFSLIPTQSVAQNSNFKQASKIHYLWYSVDAQKLVISVEHHVGWGYKMVKYRFPDRLVLNISFKDGFPDDFLYKDSLPISEKFDVTSNHILQDVHANIDEEGMSVTVSCNYPLKFEESYDEESKRLNITIPLFFSYETKSEIRPGIEFLDVFTADVTGPRKLYVIYTDLSSGRFRPTILTASDFGSKFSSVESMVQRSAAVCAINGGFYSPDGNHQGLLIRGGILESYPNFDRPVFATTTDGKIHIGSLPFSGVVRNAEGKTIKFDSVDKIPKYGEIVLLTPGHPKRISENLVGSKIIIRDYVVEKVTTANVTDKKRLYILWSPEPRDDFKLFKEGDPVEIEFMLGIAGIEVESALGGGPMLVSNGEVNVDLSGDYRSDIVKGRAPRTGIGLDKDGRLMMVMLEGRNPLGSIGANLYEFAEIMKRYGAVVAMNLDGGSSSSIVVDGVRKNFVQGSPKGVTNAVAIIDTRPISESGIIY